MNATHATTSANAEPPRALYAAIALAILALSVVFAAALHLDDRATFSQRNARPSLETDVRQSHFTLADSRALPYPLRSPRLDPRGADHAADLALAGTESALLVALAVLLRRIRGLPRVARAVALAGGIALAAEALLARTVGSADVYAYVAYAKLGIAASYAPVAGALPTGFRAIDAFWGDPIVASVYGPLWYALQHAVSGGADLGGAVVGTRLLGLVSVVAFVALLLRSSLPKRVAALACVNPALYLQYVVNAHNDLIGVDLALAAIVLGETAPFVAVAFVTLAGLVKAPFVLFALIAFRGQPPARRALYAAWTIALVLAGSYVFGGSTYLHDLVQRGARDHVGAVAPRVVTALIFILGALGLAGVAAVAVTGRSIRGLAFALAEAGFSTPQAWYFGWGFPLAALDTWTLEAMLVTFPFVAGLLDRSYSYALYPVGLAFLLVVAITAALLRPRRPDASA